MNPLKELKTLTDQFPESGSLFQSVEHIPASTTPEPYKAMLVHDHHMTVTMEDFHQCKVDVKILESRLVNEQYVRKILLLKEGTLEKRTDQVVQFGIVNFNFETVTAAVKQEILAGEIPLGRVLIQHNVLRHVDFGAILKIAAGAELAKLLQMQEGEITYGRLATIFCNNQPAIDLLEISAPLT